MWAKLAPSRASASAGCAVAPVLHPVDVGGDGREARQEVHGVLVHRVPDVVLLELALGVAARELRVPLHGQDAGGEHGHRVRVARQGAEHVEHVLPGTSLRVFHSATTSSACASVGISPVSRNQKNPSTRAAPCPAALGRAAKVSGMVLPRNRMPFLRVEVGDVGDQAADVARAADALPDVHLVDDHVANSLLSFWCGGGGPRSSASGSASGWTQACCLRPVALRARQGTSGAPFIAGRQVMALHPARPAPRRGAARMLSIDPGEPTPARRVAGGPGSNPVGNVDGGRTRD